MALYITLSFVDDDGELVPMDVMRFSDSQLALIPCPESPVVLIQRLEDSATTGVHTGVERSQHFFVCHGEDGVKARQQRFLDTQAQSRIQLALAVFHQQVW